MRCGFFEVRKTHAQAGEREAGSIMRQNTARSSSFGRRRPDLREWLKALMPALIEAMERHGHLGLAPGIRDKLLAMSAATIDRALARVREGLGRKRRRHTTHSLRRSIPIRTSSDWNDPAPGVVEADFVAHSGPSERGRFIQTLVLTDIATGWTECAPLIVREQPLFGTVLTELRKQLPFALVGLDTDNDTVFMNETLKA